MEAIDRSLLHGSANLPMLWAAEGDVKARGEVVASDLRRGPEMQNEVLERKDSARPELRQHVRFAVESELY